jgi:hypothetical protein
VFWLARSSIHARTGTRTAVCHGLRLVRTCASRMGWLMRAQTDACLS